MHNTCTQADFMLRVVMIRHVPCSASNLGNLDLVNRDVIVVRGVVALLFHFLLLLGRRDEPLGDVIVRLLQTRMARVVVHTGMIHFQTYVGNLSA